MASEMLTTLLKTEGFTVNDEMLKALSNPETSYTGSSLDKNKEGILSLDEVDGVYALTFDCPGCEITDLDALSSIDVHSLKLKSKTVEEIDNIEAIMELQHLQTLQILKYAAKLIDSFE